MRSAFWSYVREDDEADCSNITKLVNAISKEYEMQTAEKLDYFFDIQSLEWGDQWKQKIDENLGSTAYFIAVVTPKYFCSPNCRSELDFFIKKAQALGDKELFLPILYVSVPELDLEDPGDSIIKLVKSTNWVDWRENRFLETTSGKYREAVHHLVSRLVKVNNRLDERKEESLSAQGNALTVESSSDDLELGTIEKVAKFEESMEDMNLSVLSILAGIKEITSIMSSKYDEMMHSPKYYSYAYRVAVLKHLASELLPTVDTIEIEINDYARETRDIDDGLRVLLSMLAEGMISRQKTKTVVNQGEQKNVLDFFSSIETLVAAVISSTEGINQMIESCLPLEKMSRDLRPVLRKLRKALTLMLESMNASSGWLALVETARTQIGTTSEGISVEGSFELVK